MEGAGPGPGSQRLADTSNSAPWLGPPLPGLASRALPRAEVTRTVRPPTVCQLVLSAREPEPQDLLFSRGRGQ